MSAVKFCSLIPVSLVIVPFGVVSESWFRFPLLAKKKEIKVHFSIQRVLDVYLCINVIVSGTQLVCN